MSVRKTIVGLQGSGKTQLAKKMIREKTTKKQKVLVVDILGEYNEKGLGNVDIYIPNDSINPISEVSELVNNYIITPFKEQKTQPYRLVVFDEASRYLNTKLSMPNEIGYINDFARHLNIDVITIARRFTQLNTDLVELSHNLYIFNQS
jgi:GTPase SAR1 family protein